MVGDASTCDLVASCERIGEGAGGCPGSAGVHIFNWRIATNTNKQTSSPRGVDCPSKNAGEKSRAILSQIRTYPALIASLPPPQHDMRDNQYPHGV